MDASAQVDPIRAAPAGLEPASTAALKKEIEVWRQGFHLRGPRLDQLDDGAFVQQTGIEPAIIALRGQAFAIHALLHMVLRVGL